MGYIHPRFNQNALLVENADFLGSPMEDTEKTKALWQQGTLLIILFKRTYICAKKWKELNE